jgi:hypothetical protein
MTTTNAERETEITRMLDRPWRRRPLMLTPRERRLVGVRIRQLKKVIPPLLRAMQSQNPHPRDREAYHRATNELDWLLEIAWYGDEGSRS